MKHGRLRECAEAALNTISRPNETVELKSCAVSAVGALNDSILDAQLFRVVQLFGSVPNRLCSRAIETLYPRSISSAQLLEVLMKTERVEKYHVDLQFYLKSHFKSTVTSHHACELLNHLIVLARTPPHVEHGQRNLPVSEKFHWIGEIVSTVLEILLKKTNLTAEEISVAGKSLQLLGQINEYDHFSREDIGEVNSFTLKFPQVRRDYFWRAVAEFRNTRQKEPTLAYEVVDHREVLRLGSEDFDWLLSDVWEEAELNDRIVALRIAIDVWDGMKRPIGKLWRLRRATRSEPSLRKVFSQSDATGVLLPIKRFWWRKTRYRFGKWWWIHRWDAIRRCWHWFRGQFLLLRHIRGLASGRRVGWLAQLSLEADNEQRNYWTPSTWSGLEKKRGKWITRTTKHGCVAAWRRFTPQLPYEKSKPNQISNEDLVGLAGLQVEFDDDPAAISKLTENEARIAARYAMNEINGFPAWFDRLAIYQQEAVQEVLCECVEGEWGFPSERTETNEVLAHLAWYGEGFQRLVLKKLLSLLAQGDPPNSSIRTYAVAILTRRTNPLPSELAKLAAHRASSNNDAATISLWLSVWMQMDGETAVRRLEELLACSDTPGEIVVRLCSLFSGKETEQAPRTPDPNYLRPACLRRFVPLVFIHIRIADDIHRSAGGYSPTARDYAQEFRSMLLNRLESDEDATATEVLREFADHPALREVRDWILHIFDMRLVREADAEPWTPGDLREFAERHEVDPKNDRELFAIALKRLQVLKWDVEESDNSPRDDLRTGDQEILLRRWLHRWLVERSKDRYVIPQEEEIDRQERPDLRLRDPRFSGPVSIEIKWADNWTLVQLLERLETQLVGQYLRAHNSRYGIYFLGFNGKKTYWKEPTTGRYLSFDRVVDVVKSRAMLLMQADPMICGLEVVSVDFRPATTTKTAGAADG